MKRGIPPTTIRIPPELKKRLEKSAKEMRRTLSAEIVLRLEQSY
jgi:predicted DNA-binding protein